jgi:hypothetical protein
VPLGILILYTLVFVADLAKGSPGATLFVLTTPGKFGLTYGLLALTIPIGIADLWLGPSQPRTPTAAG